MSGSGKSHLCVFLLQNAQKYKPLTFIFDIGGSFQSLTTIFKGSYLNVGQEARDFTINPFSLPLFDNAEDTLSFKSFQTFNFHGWNDAPEVLEPLLFYVLHRASNEITDPKKLGTPKVFLLDEACCIQPCGAKSIPNSEALLAARVGHSTGSEARQSAHASFRQREL